MACGGFTCSKNSLITLNVVYILIGFVLVAVASYGMTANYLTSVSIIGGIIASGVLLWLIAILGLLGAIKHNQVFLFFYMVILFCLFVFQFGISCGCLAMSRDQQHELLETGWEKSSNHTRSEAQKLFKCCGFDGNSQYKWKNETIGHPECPAEICCKGIEAEKCCYESSETCQCPSCFEQMHSSINLALKASGGIGLFFSFTLFLGVWLTVRYRNQKDPRANPSAFL